MANPLQWYQTPALMACRSDLSARNGGLQRQQLRHRPPPHRHTHLPRSSACERARLQIRLPALAEGIAAKGSKPVLHGDNGATLKATTVLAMLHWLGVKPSYSRPRVSDDNAFVEALFRTAKYRPEYPKSGFTDLSDARAWAARFVRWYNLEHRHSGIRYVTPAQRHSGQDVEILKRRDELYQQARRCHPARWARHTRNWDHTAVVKLNPERDSEPIKTTESAQDKAPRCA